MNFNDLTNRERAIMWYQANPGGGGETYPTVLDDGNTVAWFDAQENITKDGSNLVSVWGDKSGSGNDLSQSTTDRRPTFDNDSVLFDGVDNSMKTAAFTLTQPEFIYMVINRVAWVSGRLFFDGNVPDQGFVGNFTPTPDIKAYAGSFSAGNSTMPVGSYCILRCLFNGASSKLQINNEAATESDFGSNDMGGLTLGSAGNELVGWSNIRVKEMIIRKVADGATDESNIYSYLSGKYSI